MIRLEEKVGYRHDIDGMRAIAVLAVFVFHCGYLPSGYLGVDIFFVISGYLITKIIYFKSLTNDFSIKEFYIRRIRRIIPLVSFFGVITLLVGVLTMLPDDLENLAQSVIATNFFSNNILQYLTTANYWDVVNEFKPLMHTWSLGIEEQYYFFYPFIFLFFRGKALKFILPILIILTIFSLGIYSISTDTAGIFYLIPARFFELSLGGIGAVVFQKRVIVTKYRLLLLIPLIILLVVNLPSYLEIISIPIIVILTLFLLVSTSSKKSIPTLVLENQLMIGIGKISFSLYMWHQVILAFSRYFLYQELNFKVISGIFILTIILSILTYYIIEQPFRNKSKVGVKALLISLSAVTLISSFASFYIYANAGVIKDVPELSIAKNEGVRGMHARYNDQVSQFNKPFNPDDNYKILVVGNSFARDWVNVLLESEFRDVIHISYLEPTVNPIEDFKERIPQADMIFWSTLLKSEMDTEILDIIDFSKTWCVGTKNFGTNNGIFYNNKGIDYCHQRTKMEDYYYEFNEQLKNEWDDKYIDLVGLTIDENGTVPVFTPDCKFISQDCRHLTQSGAQYFAELLENQPDFVLHSLK